MEIKTSLKQRLREVGAPPLLGAFVGLAEPALVEMAGRAGFDFIILDGEHGCFHPVQLEGCLRAADLIDLPAMVRLPRMDPVAIQAALDSGAEGIQIPSVETPQQTQRAVAASRFPPLGNRGYGSTTRAAGYGFRSRKQVMENAKNHNVVTVQVETKAGVENLDAILQVDGVDSIFIGTSDLSLEFGHESPSTPAMDPLLADITSRVARAGKVCGVHIVDWRSIEKHMRLGVRYFTVSALAVMGASLKELTGEFKRQVGEK